VLELRGVTKRYGPRTVVDDVTLAVARGQRVALIGPSGSGKSTILHMLVGLARPDRGAIVLLGEEVRPDTVQALRRRVGYVIQDGGLFPHLTAHGNVALLARHVGWAPARIDERIAELTRLVRLPDDALARYPVQLSGGQRQRVGVMRALMLDPEVLLLDEPFGALDPLVRADLQDDLRDVFARLGKTVVTVTHDLAEAAFLADDLVLLRDGAIVQRGALRELATAPADPFVTRFLRAQRGLDLEVAG